MGESRDPFGHDTSGEAELTDPWVALEPGADPAERVRALRRAHDRFTEGGTVQRPVRSVVADSWRRSARAGVAPDGGAGVELMDGDLGAYRAEHPLARVMPLVRELMGSFAADGEHLLAVCDAQGRLLWVEGHPTTRRRADRMNFVPGARWAESAVGTNAPGTAVALGRPVQVFAAEHFVRRVQPWTCAAAPVHDPRTGRVLGAVDITGGDGLAHPHSLGFVQAVARAAESHLALLAPPGAGADDVLELTALGRDEAGLLAGGRRIVLSRRHSEILVLLARHPEGLTGDALLCALYEDGSVTPVTLRAELARLRRLLGPGLLASRPYRLTVPVESDVTVVERRLETGAVTAAVAAYGGPLLPASRAPAVVRLRHRLADALRTALVARGDPDLLADWVHAPWGEDDLDVWRALAAVRPTAAVCSRTAELESELAAPPGWARPAARRTHPRSATSAQPPPP
ncbi:transcriptional regulator [Streptomyces ruber]|uniref:Transcriptional regulator n=2 Tax=Streptomyces TaxID=1883 RepID=A0A918BCN2_9ACTN|nr:GAF domain-containing protein [Streptomyces ruber]GGQ48965.1 transcriptional regulator [Streptomyces ruber]